MRGLAAKKLKETFIGIINNEQLAEAIARKCHDPRLRSLLEIRRSAISDYRQSVKMALNIKEKS